MVSPLSLCIRDFLGDLREAWRDLKCRQPELTGNRLADLTANALPVAHSKNKDAITAACLAIGYGAMDMAPADPVEGILIAQIIVANEAALAMYQKAWAQPPEYFQARTKYLQLADKAARTLLMLTERLDHHRGRGQQSIVVKHVTVNADRAMVADTITAAPALPSNAPLPIEQVIEPAVGRAQKSE